MRENEIATETSFFSGPDENAAPSERAPETRRDRELRSAVFGKH
jgi:hypothetical protein